MAYTMSMEKKSYMQWVFAVVALVAGLSGGYFYGHSRGVADEKAAQQAVKDQALKEVAKAVNPFEATAVNPYDKATVNPYDSVKVNPFQ